MVYSIFILIIQYFDSNNAGDFDCCEGLLSILHLLNINSMFTEVCIYKWIKLGKFKKKDDYICNTLPYFAGFCNNFRDIEIRSPSFFNIIFLLIILC